MDRLRALREQFGYTQDMVAESLNISRITYVRYESCIRNMRSTELTRAAQLYGVSIDYLLGLTDIPNAYLDTKKEPAPVEREQAQAAAAAALDGEDDADGVTLTKADRRWIRSLVDTAVDQALAERGLSPGDPAGSPGRSVRPRVSE